MKKSIFICCSVLLFICNSIQASLVYDEGQTYLKSALKITSPNSSTVWTIPNTAALEWNTENISENKTIQFYLTKDDMVVQELGIFVNNKFVENIKLNRTLAEGDNYRVMGIELNPDDKYNIAKYATPFFTIKKTPRKQPVAAKPTVKEEPEIRDTFDGRTINYVNELSVSSNEIEINLWDHGRVDGDIVSIYLNGVAIVSKYHLTYHKKSFAVTLDPTKSNDLFLYAHNLGKSPPNTVSIEIIDGAVSEQIILNSDLKSCEAVLIKVGN